MNIVCFGDSITAAGGFAEVDRWPTILQFKLETKAPGVYKVFNRGVGGHTTSQGLDRWDTDVAPLLPAIALIEFGFNDANVRVPSRVNRVSIDEFKSNLREIHRLVKAGKGKPVFVVNHAFPQREFAQGNRKSYNANYKPYGAAIKSVAKSCKAPLIDLPAMMKSRKVDLKQFVCDDGLHLSAQGNHTYAEMVYEGLQKLL